MQKRGADLFVGRSLTHVRLMNHLSRGQLAKKIGVTEQAIWQYENGYTSPKLEIVNQLKKIFHVKAAYFFEEDLLKGETPGSIEMQHIAYRSETVNSSGKTQSEHMHIRFLDGFLKRIEGRISYPPNVLVKLRNEVLAYVHQHPDMARLEQLEYIAKISRDALQMPRQSNENLLFLLEKAGAFIFEKEIGESIDAYSLWTEDDRPYIMLGTVKKSAVRRNFDLAHELGHLLLHYKTEFTVQDRKSYRVLEDEANQFASAFLMPDAFHTDCGALTKISNPDTYLDIKAKWEVSLQAIAMRLYRLGLLEYQQYRYFFMSINKKGYKLVEPLDDEIPIHRPMKMKSILQLVFDKGIYPASELQNDLKVDIAFLTQLTGIEEAFFEAHRRQEQKKFTVHELTFK